MRRTILVADGDPRTRRLLRVALEPRAFAVLDAPDPISTLTLLLWIPVALVVINPRQPGSRQLNPTACRLLRWIHRGASFVRLPIVMFADSPLTDDEQRAMGARGVEVVQKTEGVPHLAARIRALTANYQPTPVTQREARFMPFVMTPAR